MSSAAPRCSAIRRECEMATTIVSSWFFSNVDLFPLAEEDDETLPQVGITLYNRAPHLEDDSTLTGWATAIELADLLDSPHWQPPGRYVEGNLVLQATAAVSGYYTSEVDGRVLASLEDTGFVVGEAGAPTATPVIALSIWYNGTLGGKVKPLIMTTRLDSPVLLMADADHPVRVKSGLLFSWVA